MKQIKWIFVIYAILAAFSIMGIGVAIGEKSILGVIGCVIAVVVVMGFGFKTKAKLRKWRIVKKKPCFRLLFFTIFLL